MSLVPIDEVVHFDVITSDPTDEGAAVDADSAPTFDVFEESTDTPIMDDQSMTKRTSLTGNYRGSFTASAANGFEAGKWYSVVVTAVVGGKTGKCVAKHFRCAPAESVAGVPKGDVSHFGGSAGTFSSGRPEVNTTLIEGSDATNQIRDAVVDDATRIDASALNTLSSHDPGETIMGATDLGTGSGLTSLATAAELAKVPKSDSNVTWNATAAAQLQSEVADALTAYDPPTRAEATSDKDEILATTADIEGKVDDLETRLGTPSDLGSGATVAANLVDIEAQTDDIGAAGAGLTALATAAELAKVPKSDSNVTWNATAAAQIQSEANDALVANHLDHLLAATYDPASKPGAADALLNELIENDGGVARYTANALEEGPGGGSAPTAEEIADAVWDEDLTGHTTPDSAGEILGNVATGTPPTAAAIADAVWDEATAGHTTSGTFGEQLKTDVDAILEDTGTTLQGELDGIQADTEDIQSRLPASLSSGRMRSDAEAISASTAAADNVEANIGNLDAQVSTRLATSGYTAPLTAAGTRTAIGLATANLDTQLGDLPTAAENASQVRTELTTELGRIDVASSTRASQTSVDDVPTNSELATALAAADDAVLAAIAALNNLSAAQVLTQVNSALTTAVADSVPADGSRPSIAQGVYMSTQFLYERSTSGTTVTVKKPDGTTLCTLTLDDATTPTSITRAS